MSKINVTLPDGSIRTYPQGITAFDVAKSISEGLARNVLAAEVNGQVWDSTRPLPENTALKLLTWNLLSKTVFITTLILAKKLFLLTICQKSKRK